MSDIASDEYAPDKHDIIIELRKLADEIESGLIEPVDFKVLSNSEVELGEEEAIRFSYRLSPPDEQPGD